MTKKRTLSVKGEGRIFAPPDMMRLDITLGDEAEDYADVAEMAAVSTDEVRKALMKCGFDHKEIKTKSFEIETKTEEYKDKKGNYREAIVGYEYFQNIEVVFPRDLQRATDAMYL